jgi:hypothetical protein
MLKRMHIHILYISYVFLAVAGEKLGLKLDSLKQQLQDEDCKMVLTHCKEPKSFNEIKATKIKESRLFKVLKELKISEALLFADGKYFTSPEAFEYLL